MGSIIDLFWWAIFAVLGVVTLYIVIRVGTLAVCNSIKQVQNQSKGKQSHGV